MAGDFPPHAPSLLGSVLTRRCGHRGPGRACVQSPRVWPPAEAL